MNAAGYATEFFLDRPPSAEQISKLSVGAKEPLVARVRILGKIGSLGPREQSGLPPSRPAPVARYGAYVEVSEIIQGQFAVGARLDVVFGEVGEKYVIPYTPQMYAREYFIVSYLGSEGVRRLVGFPVTAEVYARWESQVWEYERERGRPFHQQD